MQNFKAVFLSIETQKVAWNARDKVQKTRFFATFWTSRTSNSSQNEGIDTPIAYFNRGNNSEQNCSLSLASDITVLWTFFVLWKKKKYLIFSVRGIAHKKFLRRAINSRFSQFFSAQRIPQNTSNRKLIAIRRAEIVKNRGGAGGR